MTPSTTSIWFCWSQDDGIRACLCGGSYDVLHLKPRLIA